jgi:hypothetical protein
MASFSASRLSVAGQFEISRSSRPARELVGDGLMPEGADLKIIQSIQKQ